MKYALVTGGSRGIGRAICLNLAQKGYHVIINYVSNKQAADDTLAAVEALGGSGELLKFNVADKEETEAAINGWIEKAGDDKYIEVLVNNAGIRKDHTFAMMEDNEWTDVLSTTLNGFYNVTKPLIMPMQINRFGRIINMASVSGIKGLPGQTNYSCAKGGIIAATKALAQEVARRGVTVNAIAPGFIKTDMVEGLDEAALKKQIPANRFGKPEEVAALVGFLVSPEAGYITGNVISINGGLYT